MKKALDLTKQALEKLDAGDEEAANQLLDQAKKIDPTAPVEVVEEMDEDAQNRTKG